MKRTKPKPQSETTEPAPAPNDESRSPVPPTGVTVPFSTLRPNRLQPRTVYEDIPELAESLRATNGLLQNLVVRPHPDEPGCFEITAGERRFRALDYLISRGELTLDHPVPVTIRELTDVEMLELALVENAARQDLEPLDEGEAFLKLQEMGGGRGKGFTKALATKLGKTQRWVQLRIQLARDLCDYAKAALREERISLDQARALSEAPAERQLSVLGSAIAQRASADEIRRRLCAGLPLVSSALFPLARYQGAYVGQPGGKPEERAFADVEKFIQLQGAAVEERQTELAQEYAFADVVNDAYHLPYEVYRRLAEDDPTPKAERGAVLLVSPDYDVRIVENVARVSPAPDFDGDEGDEGGELYSFPGATTPPPPPEAAPFTKAHLYIARRRRTQALQRGISANPQVALRLACLAMLGGQECCRLVADTRHQDLQLDPAVAEVLDSAAGSLGLTRDGHRYDSSTKSSWHWIDDAPLWKALSQLDDQQVSKLFCAITGSLTGCYQGEAGDSPMTLALAASLCLEHAGPVPLDEELLRLYRKSTLIALAVASGAVPDSDRRRLANLTMAEIRKEILESPTRALDFLPTEFRYLSDAEMATALRALVADVEGAPEAEQNDSEDHGSPKADDEGAAA